LRVSTSGLPYENAQALYHLATAYAGLGEFAERDELLTRARKLAKARGFFELLHKTDPDLVTRAAQPPSVIQNLTRSSRDVVASLSEFEVGEAAGLLSLTRSS
jgi:hypothetical protein